MELATWSGGLFRRSSSIGSMTIIQTSRHFIFFFCFNPSVIIHYIFALYAVLCTAYSRKASGDLSNRLRVRVPDARRRKLLETSAHMAVCLFLDPSYVFGRLHSPLRKKLKSS